MGICHWDPESKSIKPGPGPTHVGTRTQIQTKHGDKGGISFQIPEGWDDGSGKVRHVKDGPFAGRVYWTTQAEARDIARRLEDKGGTRVRYGESSLNSRRK